ncbi:hypothetical protein [Chryseobacterium wanjuense]
MKFSFYLLLSLLAISCSKNQDIKLTCEQQKEKAKIDFKYNNFTYFEEVERSDGIDYYPEFEQLLSKNNIKIVFDTIVPTGCIPETNKDPNHKICYKRTMNNDLEIKFGETFFDSLRIKATTSTFTKIRI